MDLLAGAIGWLVDPAHWQGPDGIPIRIVEHLVISAAALVVAVLVALPIGLWIGHTGRFAFLAVNIANIGRAIPSYGAMAMIWPISLAISPEFGLNLIPTFAAMTLLGIPPIMVNAYAGVREVDRDLVEAARGMGMRERQVLGRIELPIALPVAVGGIRTAAVQIVATTTLGAVLGLGGLGRYLIDGIARRDFERLWAGVILVAGLAILTEVAIGLLQRRLTARGVRRPREDAFRAEAELPRAGGEIAAQ